MKKGACFVIGFFVIISFVFISSLGVDKTRAYHNSTNVSIGIDGINQTINTFANNFTFPLHTYVSGLPLNPGHNINQIWVSVKDGEMSLFQALNSTNKLCPASPVKTNYTSSPSDKSQPYHYAAEIQMASGKNLQEAINDGDLCYFWYTNLSTCSVSCGGGIRTTYCSYKNLKVADNYCYGTKPSVICNTQGCIWTIVYRSCMPSSCGGGCPNIAGTSCSPANSTRFCCIDYGCGAAGSLGIRFVCQ